MRSNKFSDEFKRDAVALVAGERDPDILATCRDVRCRASPETVRAALVGNDCAEHIFALAQSLDLYDVYQRRSRTAMRG